MRQIINNDFGMVFEAERTIEMKEEHRRRLQLKHKLPQRAHTRANSAAQNAVFNHLKELTQQKKVFKMAKFLEVKPKVNQYH